MIIRKAVLPVAGLGTRFLPATKAQPKEMLPLVDKPLVQYAVEEVAASGIPMVIFVTGRGKDAIENHFDVAFELEHELAGRGKEELRKQPNSANLHYSLGQAYAKRGAFNDAVEEARFLMRTRRHLKQDEKDNFGIVTPDAITGFKDRLLGPTMFAGMGVPFIALVVGGIVIMNIMLVSVTERTKEIGIRKSLGARQKDILKQFLIEAITMAAIGGAIGVLLAWIIGRIMTAVFFPTFLSIGAILFTIVVSGTIGILAGIIPAWKAARLDPIEALRAD